MLAFSHSFFSFVSFSSCLGTKAGKKCIFTREKTDAGEFFFSSFSSPLKPLSFFANLYELYKVTNIQRECDEDRTVNGNYDGPRKRGDYKPWQIELDDEKNYSRNILRRSNSSNRYKREVTKVKKKKKEKRAKKKIHLR